MFARTLGTDGSPRSMRLSGEGSHNNSVCIARSDSSPTYAHAIASALCFAVCFCSSFFMKVLEHDQQLLAGSSRCRHQVRTPPTKKKNRSPSAQTMTRVASSLCFTLLLRCTYYTTLSENVRYGCIFITNTQTSLYSRTDWCPARSKRCCRLHHF